MLDDQYMQPIRTFLEAGNKRLNDMLLGVQRYETPQLVCCRYELPRREVADVARIPHFKSIDLEDDYDELLKENGIIGGKGFIVNDCIKSMLHNFMMELIRRGLVVCEIKEHAYNPKTYSIELSAVVDVPSITAETA